MDVEGWEAVALTLAELSGIRTSTWTLLPAGAEKSVLLLDRFDRAANGQRIGYISAATALQIGTHDDRRITYEEFSDTIGDLSADPRADLREMFTRIALTVLLHNVDDHWRNHGFLHTTRGWRLSPAFDVNPSPRPGSVLSRPISDEDDPRDRDIRNLAAVARSFRLSRAEAVDVIQRVAEHVAGWRAHATRLGLPDAQQEAMRPAFESIQLDRARALSRTETARGSNGTAPGTGPRRRDTDVSQLEFGSKAEALAAIGSLLDSTYSLRPGSTLPSTMFTDAARFAGVPAGGSMPERAERVARAAGLEWGSDHDSRETPSGGGSTVTLVGLNKLVEALRSLAS